MKLNIDNNKITFKYLDESLYVLSHKNKIMSNTKLKTKSYSSIYKNRIIAFLICTLIFLIWSIFAGLNNDQDSLNLYSTLFLFTLCFTIIYFNSLKKIKQQINDRLKNKDDIILEVNDGEIKFSKPNEQNVNLNWESIQYIFIGNYSIVFVSKKENLISIAVPIDYKEEILSAIKKYKKEDMIINN